MKQTKLTKKWWLIPIFLLVVVATYIYIDGRKTDVSGKVIVCIPVYGQSLALGEEAERVTDFSEFAAKNNGRVVTENIDDKFGFFDPSPLKQYFKRLVRYRKRSFELSIYAMASSLAQQLGADTVICTFPGGQGATALSHLGKGSAPYDRFIADIAKAHRLAMDGGAKLFVVPAICWMQGESDIADYPDTHYKLLLKAFAHDIGQDIQAITRQATPVRLICYQANALSRGEHFNADSYDCPETEVPQSFVELLSTDTLFWASGPTYPYAVVREAVHIDGAGQQHIGNLAAKSAIGILHHEERFTGLLPDNVAYSDSDVTIHFRTPCPPLVFDTLQVAKARHYGFSIVDKEGHDISQAITLDSCSVTIKCSSPPAGCRVRYAVNGDRMKSGNLHGPRGNLRDSQGNVIKGKVAEVLSPLHNWCYQFDIVLSE